MTENHKEKWQAYHFSCRFREKMTRSYHYFSNILFCKGPNYLQLILIKLNLSEQIMFAGLELNKSGKNTSTKFLIACPKISNFFR